MFTYLRLTLAISTACLVLGCAEHASPPVVQSASTHRLAHVRTTAYARGDGGGRRNAIGHYLSGHEVMSAASDWSHFPLGTRFRVVGTKDEYIIDDYGTALIGTNTIDLYKPTALEMRRWGVRHVDIDILQWGSREQSLKVLGPRRKHPSVQRMIAALEKKSPSWPSLD
jgi:3D (Asp-Asp-Asp) domain-containing protein